MSLNTENSIFFIYLHFSRICRYDKDKQSRGVASESSGVRILARSWSLPQKACTTRLYIEPSTMLFGRCTVVVDLIFCLYAMVHLLLEKCRISLKSSLSTQSLFHTISHRIESESKSDFGPGVGVQIFHGRSRSPKS